MRFFILIMDFEEMQEKVIKNAVNYGEKYNVKIDEDFALLKLCEEVGEFFQAVLIHRKKCRFEKFVSEDVSKKEVAKEMADILGMLIVNAHLFDINLTEAIKNKWIDKKKNN
jgi:NTP pyrophosphatase (non-canonical NTP hydrolase)